MREKIIHSALLWIGSKTHTINANAQHFIDSMQCRLYQHLSHHWHQEEVFKEDKESGIYHGGTISTSL
jgi:hypothetical protein